MATRFGGIRAPVADFRIGGCHRITFPIECFHNQTLTGDYRRHFKSGGRIEHGVR